MINRLTMLALSLLVTLHIGCAAPPSERVIETAHFKIPKSVPLTPQHPINIEAAGLPNFGFVTPDIWRGGEPTKVGIQTLKTMGVKTIIDLRETDASADIPPSIRYVSLPVSMWHADRVDTHAVLHAIAVSPKPLFIHCREGRDRTGLAIAAFRLSQGMSPADACQELRNFRVNFWWETPITDRIHHLRSATAGHSTTAPSASGAEVPVSRGRPGT
jgi:protein tyrosine phosphatase (PTP) superfamily phosphohydrolase (DUF442 family)